MAYPTAAQVLATTVFGASNELTGTRTDAAVGKVKAGTTYGAGGTALVGTYNPFVVGTQVQLRENLDLGVDLNFSGRSGQVKVSNADGTVVGWSTLVNGRWLNPVTVNTGATYTIVFTAAFSRNVIRTRTLAL